MNRNTGILAIAFISATLILGCSSSNDSDKKTSQESVLSEEEKSDSVASSDSSNPEVSVVPAGSSKPISESEGSAKDKLKGELYEVPNRFPIKEREEQEKLEEQRKKDQQDEEEQEKKINPPH